MAASKDLDLSLRHSSHMHLPPYLRRHIIEALSVSQSEELSAEDIGALACSHEDVSTFMRVFWGSHMCAA